MIPTFVPAMRYGGPVVAVDALCRHLARLGHDVHVCCTSMDGEGDLDVPLDAPVQRDGVTVRYFAAGGNRRLAVSPAMARWLDANADGFDVVHLHSVFQWPPWYAARAAHRKGVPYVVTPHGMLVRDLVRRNRMVKTLWWWLFDRRSLERAGAVHFTTPLELREAREFGVPTRRAAVIPLGIEMDDADDRLADAEVPAGPFVLHLGRLNWKKGADRLIEALAFAPEVRVVIAGHDESGLAQFLQALARERRVEERVHFMGPVHGAQKWRLIRAARALVLPSRSENFGLVVLEAMAAGCPVVVSPAVGLADAVLEAGCGRVVDPEPPRLAIALRELWDDGAIRQVMGRRGMALVKERYGWPTIASQMADLYGTLAEERRARAHE